MGSWIQIRKREEGGIGAARLSEELMNTPAPLFWSSQQEIKGSLGQEDEPRKQRTGAVWGTVFLLSARTDGQVRAHSIPVQVWVLGWA